MTTIASLDSIIEKWSLLHHPFYRAWNEVNLSMDALRVYAAEYGNLIDILPSGWLAIQDEITAGEELDHANLWKEFSIALGAVKNEPSLIETKSMITLCTRLFSEPASALGALYAFEAQQPRIAISKLQGIKDYYPLPEMAVSYFKVHSQNAQEVDKIRISINELPKEEKSVVINSCELMCEFCGMPYRVFLRIRRTSNRF